VSVNDAAVRPAKVWGKREPWADGVRKWQCLFNGTGSDSSVGQVPPTDHKALDKDVSHQVRRSAACETFAARAEIAWR
jgi:hypothetical protein